MNYALIYRNNRLELDFPELGKPLFVDFQQSRYQKIEHLRNELLAKAIGIKKNILPTICDLTAGWGSDAYLLYSLGCKIKCIERSPIIAELLKDGLMRAGCNINLYIGEAKDYLNQLLEKKDFPDVIYFDPIFPEKNKSALSQKSARILRAIAGKDEDAKEVFELALQVAKTRVVVKRPLHAECISDIKPDIVFRGKSIRFDVYLISESFSRVGKDA
jgi:16S rRNA (guanine1516-N2)-methyltransferase